MIDEELKGIGFRWSDAWLLLSVGLAAETGSATLAAVIAAADVIQHAIMTKEELDGGVERLSRGGLLELKTDSLTLTPRGRAMVDHAANATSTIRSRAKLIEDALGAVPWAPGDKPDQARGNEGPLIAQEDYVAAVKSYHKSFWRQYKSL